MHDFVSRLSVTGLFGYVHHDLTLRVPEQITILTGVNGSGKTHVLNLLRNLVAFDLITLHKVPCAAASLTYESGRRLAFEQLEPGMVRLEGSTSVRDLGSLTVRVLADPLEDVVPSFIERFDDDLWIDRTDGELISAASLAARYGVRTRGSARPGIEVVDSSEHDIQDWISAFRSAAPPTLVETRRLDTRILADPRRATRGAHSVSRIRQYVDDVAEQIASARRASLEVSQRADRQFAARALDKARATIKEVELRRNYQTLASLNQELNQNGLTEASMGVDFPGGTTNPTERRILSVFLEDWADKLEPLGRVHRKLQTLRSVVGHKIVGKAMVIDGGEMKFINRITAEPLRVERLSSGEQHLLALFTMLIFAAEPGSLVLIDEPEISLHAAWKHAFLDDIRNVAILNDLQVVLATHSSGIVHGHWDLTEELQLPEQRIAVQNEQAGALNDK